MTRVICCNRFLSQSVLSPDWPVGCLCSSGDCLIVASGPRQLSILEWISEPGGGAQLMQCGQLDIGLPIIQVRCCPHSGLLVALCSAEAPSDRGVGTVCQAFLNWRNPAPAGSDGALWRHAFSEHRRANLIRVDLERVVLAESRTVSVYHLKTDGQSRPLGFELTTVLEMEFVLTQLEINASTSCMLAAAANRLLLLQLRRRPQLSMAETGREKEDCGSVNEFSLFDFDDHAGSAEAADESRQQGKLIQLNAKPKERLFPATKPVCRVAFSQSQQMSSKTWLLKTMVLQGDDRLHSLSLWPFDSDHLMAFFSTRTQGFIFCLHQAEDRIEKLVELRYNSAVHAAVIGADGLLHTLSNDLVESYTTHQPLCRLSSSIASSVGRASESADLATTATSTVPNLLIGSQMFPGIFALAAHGRGLLLASSAADEEEPAGGGRLLSTLYTLTFESTPNLVEDLIEKCQEFKQDSEEIYKHLGCEAAFLLLTSPSASSASNKQREKFFLFVTDLIRDQPQDLIAARLMLDYLQPSLDEIIKAVGTDPAKLLRSTSLVSYIRDGLLGSAKFSLPDHQSAVWPCLEQLLRALLARESTAESAALLIRLLGVLPSNGPMLSRLCSHQLPRLNPGSLIRCLAAFAAGDDTSDKADDSSSISGLCESEIGDWLPALVELAPLEHFAVFFQRLFAQQPLAVCSAMESMSRFDWRFAQRLPWPLSVYFTEVRWLEPMLDIAETSTEYADEDFKHWSELLVEQLERAVELCRGGSGSGCQLPIDVSLSTPDGVLKRLLSLLYNLPSMESRTCCCLSFVAQRILLLLWLRPDPPPTGFASLCHRLNSVDSTLALCVSHAPLLLIGCRDSPAAANPKRASRLIPLLQLEADTRRRLIGCLKLSRSDWLELIDAAAGSQSDCEAVIDLASRFADRATLELLLEAGATAAASGQEDLLFHCTGIEHLRSQRDELTRLLAGQLAE